MPDLKSAEEWHTKMLELLTDWDHQHKDGSREAELEILRDIQRNALEAAAKAVEVVPEANPVRRAARWDCAQAVRRLLPETPAPADDHRRGGIVITRDKTPSGNDMTYITRENPAPAGQDENQEANQ